MPKIILTTGGTGGHIFPALAVADVLRQKKADLLFIGATYGREADLVARAGIPFLGLPSRGFLGRGLAAIPAAFDLLRALAGAIKAVRRYSPCAVAAFGGYACFAPALAAVLLRVPLLLHEQNAIAGVSIRFLSRLAATVCASMPDTSGLKRDYIVTGNPVRSDIQPARRNFASRHLLVLGGSQGAHGLNEYIVNHLPDLKKAGIAIRHQTGSRDFQWVAEAYESAGYSAQDVSPFIEDMAAAYSWADLAFCRAGASTVAEICMAGLPSILVPFPAAIHDHQTLNARVLAEAGASILIQQYRLEDSPEFITSLLEDPQKLQRMSQAAAGLAKPVAADQVASEILKLCA